MRSNMASTCGSASRPAALIKTVLLEARQERDELVELLRILLLQRSERRHRRRRVHEGPRDGLATEARPDLREGRPRPGIAVLADLVAAQAPGRRRDVLAPLVLRSDLHVDFGRRARDRA